MAAKPLKPPTPTPPTDEEFDAIDWLTVLTTPAKQRRQLGDDLLDKRQDGKRPAALISLLRGNGPIRPEIRDFLAKHFDKPGHGAKYHPRRSAKQTTKILTMLSRELENGEPPKRAQKTVAEHFKLSLGAVRKLWERYTRKKTKFSFGDNLANYLIFSGRAATNPTTGEKLRETADGKWVTIRRQPS